MKAYLGDSVYAEDEGSFGTIKLTLENGEGPLETTAIYLEPEVIDKLNAFIDKVKGD